MKITVIVCTFNRFQSLAKALESVARSKVPESIQWEVLVVDNNSRDATRSVVEEFCRREPSRFRYLFEPKQGKSHALNSGCQAANADVLVFMDDDVEVDSHWLQNLTARLDRKEWAGAGGRILPERGFVPQRWMDLSSRYGLAPLAMFDPGGEPGELREPPFGTNMAFRKEMFSRHGCFRLDLGPQPGGEIKNEDVEFGARLLAAGEQIWYEPSAIVYHAIPQHRVRKSYFLKWWYGKGRADIREFGSECGQRLSVFGVPLVLFRRLIIWTARWLLTFDPSQRFAARAKAWWLAGKIRESFSQFSRDNQLHVSQSQSTQ